MIKIPYKFNGYPFWNPKSGHIGAAYIGAMLFIMALIWCGVFQQCN